MKKQLPNVWTPPESVTRHCTSDSLEKLTFFVGPPSDIGEVRSANSTLSSISPPSRVSKPVVIVLISCLVWTVVAFFSFSNSVAAILVGIIAAVALIAAVIVGDKRYCSFIGQYGVCNSAVMYSVSSKPKTRTLLFEEAITLYTSQTQNYVNGVYAGTAYQYKWTLKDKSSYVLSGNYRSKEGTPPAGDPFYFAKAAENAWTDYLLPIVNQDFKELGHVDFPMSGKLQMIRMSHNCLEFTMKNGETHSTAVADMKDIKLQGGMFYFNHKDSHWWSGKGKYHFSFSTIPNAQLFMLCLYQIAGLRFS